MAQKTTKKPAEKAAKKSTKNPAEKAAVKKPTKKPMKKATEEIEDSSSKARRIWGKAIDTVTYIIAFVFFFSMALLIGFRFASNHSASLMGYEMYEVASNSMYPELKVGDLIIVKSGNDVEAGDIITYQEEDYLVTHRVVSVNDDLVVTKGDYNNTEDTPIHKDSIVGVMVTKATFLGFIESSKIPIIIILIILVALKFFIKKK